MSKKILLLEDDYELAETIQELLELHNYNVDIVHTGNCAIDITYEKKYDLYIFDINVPDISGIQLLENLRVAEDTTPTIFISALVDLNSIAKGFEVGAYDYIKKTFYPEELLIRLQAKFTTPHKKIELNNLTYYPDKKELFKDGNIVALGEVQLSLFDLFIHNIDRVLETEVLMDCLLQPSSTTLRVALNKLKKTTGISIKNIRAIGYVLEKS